MFFATVRFTVAKNPDKCPNLRTVGNYMSNCRKKRTSPLDWWLWLLFEHKVSIMPYIKHVKQAGEKACTQLWQFDESIQSEIYFLYCTYSTWIPFQLKWLQHIAAMSQSWHLGEVLKTSSTWISICSFWIQKFKDETGKQNETHFPVSGYEKTCRET